MMAAGCLLVLWLCAAGMVGAAEDGDPLTSLRIVSPVGGSAVTLPVVVRLLLRMTSTEAFESYYGDFCLCVELNGKWTSCETSGGPPTFDNLPEDNYTARAFVADKTATIRYYESDEVKFAVMSPQARREYHDKLLEQSRVDHGFPKDVDIVTWAEQQQQDGESRAQADRFSRKDYLLVIGIKTAVVASFPRRQAIRETWASPATLPDDVKVLFLAGEPNMTSFTDVDREKILHAVNLERTIYGDLLTEELECIDSYGQLADKVKSFMHLAAVEFPNTKFVMLADDDIYLRVDQLAEFLRQEAPRERLYLGEVWAMKYAPQQKPVRDPQSQYFLPESKYQLRTLLPYASGAFYVLSMDCIQFVARNYWRLRSVNGLEDVSTAIWLLQMQVRVNHEPTFSTIRDYNLCENELTSFADLSTLGVRSIHANLANNRSFCNGFHHATWHHSANVLPDAVEMLQKYPSQQGGGVSLQLSVLTSGGQNEVIISTSESAGFKVVFSPEEDVDEVIRRVCAQVHHNFPHSTRSSKDLAQEIRRQLAHVSSHYT